MPLKATTVLAMWGNAIPGEEKNGRMTVGRVVVLREVVVVTITLAITTRIRAFYNH